MLCLHLVSSRTAPSWNIVQGLEPGGSPGSIPGDIGAVKVQCKMENSLLLLLRILLLHQRKFSQNTPQYGIEVEGSIGKDTPAYPCGAVQAAANDYRATVDSASEVPHTDSQQADSLPLPTELFA